MILSFYFIIRQRIKNDILSSEDNTYYLKLKTYKFNLLITQTWVSYVLIYSLWLL